LHFLPDVKTLTNLRQEYEINNQRTNFGGLQDSNDRTGNSNASSFEGDRRVSLNERAMEDQVSQLYQVTFKKMIFNNLQRSLLAQIQGD
jgi:hypothetical protein